MFFGKVCDYEIEHLHALLRCESFVLLDTQVRRSIRYATMCTHLLLPGMYSYKETPYNVGWWWCAVFQCSLILLLLWGRSIIFFWHWVQFHWTLLKSGEASWAVSSRVLAGGGGGSSCVRWMIITWARNTRDFLNIPSRAPPLLKIINTSLLEFELFCIILYT